MTVARFLMDNYYSKYPLALDKDVTEEMMIKALDLNKDKVVVVMKGEEIKGVAVFVTLTDDTYAKLETLDISKVQVVIDMLKEDGDNIHFILVACSGMGNILKGIKIAKKTNPRTISWWNPTMNKLHKYNLN